MLCPGLRLLKQKWWCQSMARFAFWQLKLGLLGLCLLSGLAGCSEDVASGEVYGSLFVPDCVDGQSRDFSCPDSVSVEMCEAFDLDVTFFAFQIYPDHSAKLRLQKGGSDFALTDGLVFQIGDTRQLRGRLGERIPVAQGENIRAGLGLFERCQGSTQNFELTGTIIFERFGIDKGDRIKARLVGLEVRDGRGGGAGMVLGFLQGKFEFDVHLGPPYQRFQE